MATSRPFVQLKPSSLDLYLPDKESNLKSKKSKQLSRLLHPKQSSKSTPSLAWSIITRTISHVVPTYSHHLPHLPRKVPDSRGQTNVNTTLTNSNAFLQNKQSLLIPTSLHTTYRTYYLIWNLHRRIEQTNWISNSTKRTTFGILQWQTYRRSDSLHRHWVGSPSHCQNSPRVSHYSSWSHYQDLYGSQKSYLCKLQYQSCPPLTIDCWGVWTRNCLPSWSAQHCCRFPKPSSHFYRLYPWDSLHWRNLSHRR